MAELTGTSRQDMPEQVIARLRAEARIHLTEQRYPEAKDSYIFLLKQCEQEFGPASEAALRTAIELSGLYDQQKQYEEAVRVLLTSLHNARSKLGDLEHHDLVALRRQLAMMYLKQKEYHNAKVHLNLVRKLLSEAMDSDPPEGIESSELGNGLRRNLYSQFTGLHIQEHAKPTGRWLPEKVYIANAYDLARTNFYLEDFTSAEQDLRLLLHPAFQLERLYNVRLADEVLAWLGSTLLKQARYHEAFEVLDSVSTQITMLKGFDGLSYCDIDFLTGYAAYHDNNLSVAERKFQTVVVRSQMKLEKVLYSEGKDLEKYYAISEVFNARAWLDHALAKLRNHEDAEANLHQMGDLVRHLRSHAVQSMETKSAQAKILYYVLLKLARTACVQNRFAEAMAKCQKAIELFETEHGKGNAGAKEARQLMWTAQHMNKDYEKNGGRVALPISVIQEFQLWGCASSSLVREDKALEGNVLEDKIAQSAFEQTENMVSLVLPRPRDFEVVMASLVNMHNMVGPEEAKSTELESSKTVKAPTLTDTPLVTTPSGPDSVESTSINGSTGNLSDDRTKGTRVPELSKLRNVIHDISTQNTLQIPKIANQEENNTAMLMPSQMNVVDQQKASIEIQMKDMALSLPIISQDSLTISQLSTRSEIDLRVNALFKIRTTSTQAFQDNEIADIKSWLDFYHPKWSISPRTYIIFRTMNHLDLLDQVLESGFSDYQLPVAELSFPRCLDIELRTVFMKAQQLVLNTVSEFQRQGYAKHYHLGVDESLPFDIKQRLGSGTFGQVDRVVHRSTQQEYALKRVPRKAVSDGKGLRGLKGIISEIEILKNLHHEHIVTLVGSYTDHRYLGLLMTPVAEMDLAAYLVAADNRSYATIRSFYGCLASGLQFLHSNQIRHKDIKPQNILFDHGTILLADFGLAREFKDASTTVGRDNWTSPRYAAPEVMLQEARNTKSDIWSLGVVFLEMTVVLKDHNNLWLDEFLEDHGHQSRFVRSNQLGLQELLSVLREHGSKCDNIPLIWTEQMLQETQMDRPTAAMLISTIISGDNEHMDNNGQFCGICCRYSGDSSDTDEDEDEDSEDLF